MDYLDGDEIGKIIIVKWRFISEIKRNEKICIWIVINFRNRLDGRIY